MTDPDRVLLAGDTHGNKKWIHELIDLAGEYGCTAIVQLGDFGYWPHSSSGHFFLESVDNRCRMAGLEFWWIDGNHENHASLDRLPREGDGTVLVRPAIRYLPRGHRWIWHSKVFGALGGAHSIDWRGRVAGESWWPQERLKADDVARLAVGGPLDVLLTHDAPSFVSFDLAPVHPSDEQTAFENRQFITDAITATRPALVCHGHLHVRYTARCAVPAGSDEVHEFSVEGLASDIERDGGSWGVLALPSLVFLDGTALGWVSTVLWRPT